LGCVVDFFTTSESEVYMDQQLKQRLIGATIIASLVVIFVPMLFEDRQGDQSTVGAGDIPALPREIEERSIELPKSAAEAAPSDEQENADTGYRIIPLTDGDSKTAESERTAVADSGEKSGNREDPAANSDSITADDGVIEDTGIEQSRPAAKSAGQESVQAVKTEKPVATKVKQAPVKKSKLEPEPLTFTSDEEVASDSAPSELRGRTEQSVAPPKTKAKAAPARSAEAGPKKPEATKTVEPSAGVKSVSSSFQKSAQTRPSFDNARPVQPESVAKAAENPTRPTMGAAPAKLPEPQVPASEPKPGESDDLAAWVVQTGSFTAEGNARSLADKLRKSNFPAFVEVVTNAGTSVYRVQVGPELNRTRAEQVQKQIENTVGIKGFVVPHP